MIILWTALAVVAALFLLDRALLHLFKNPENPHKSTPADYDIPFEEVRFPTQGNKSLYGWWVPAGAGAAPTLILVHGWGRNVERTLPYIRRLHKGGWHFFAFDSRNHGSSDKDSFSSMLKFARDIRAAVDFLQTDKKERVRGVGVLGLSIGGAAAIYAAAHDERIKCAVTVGAFAHPGDIMRDDMKRRRMPPFLIAPLLRYVEHKIGARLDAIAPVNNIGAVSAPVFLIHGEKDETVPVEHGRRLSNAGDPEKTALWVVPGRRHSDCHLHAEFWDRLEVFLRRALG